MKLMGMYSNWSEVYGNQLDAQALKALDDAISADLTALQDHFDVDLNETVRQGQPDTSRLDADIEAMEREMKSARRETALHLADGFERAACAPGGMVARAGDVVIRAEAYLAFLNGDAS